MRGFDILERELSDDKRVSIGSSEADAPLLLNISVTIMPG